MTRRRFPKLHSVIPAGDLGGWSVEKFTVTEQEAEHQNRMDAIQNAGQRSRDVYAGDYTRLVFTGARGRRTTVMSDTPAEIDELRPLWNHAKGHVLVNGLGLGLAVQLLLIHPDVTAITVIEIEQCVIELVSSALKARAAVRKKPLRIIHENALDYKPPRGVKYGAVWHDIWDTICSDNLQDMYTLHRKYGRRTDWQGSWCRADCEDAKRMFHW